MENYKIKVETVEVRLGRYLHNFNAAKELAWAWNAQENIILFGPGGYGKSDAAVLFAQLLKRVGAIQSDPFTMSFGQGMTEEKIFGGIDIKKFQNSGEIEYLLRNSWIMHEFVIWEELWDANPAVLLILKDALQSGYIRMGNQKVKIKTKMIVACTNRSRDEVVSDASTEALMQRFLFEKEVKWDSHLPADYNKAFFCATGVQNDISSAVANICYEVNSDEYTVSPRTAGKALKSARLNGVESLAGMHGFADAVKKWEAKKIELDKEADLVLKFKNFANTCNVTKVEFFDTNSFVKKAACVKRIHEQGQRAYATGVTDGLVDRKRMFLDNTNSLVQTLLKKTVEVIINPPTDSFPARFKRLVQRGDWVDALNLVKTKE